MIFVYLILALIIVAIVIYVTSNSNDKSSETKSKNRSVGYTVSTSEIKKEHDPEYVEYIKKYPKWFSENKTIGICFESESIKPLSENQIETVHYKTDRFADLFGRGKDCSYFPGYGEIHNRTFEIWHQKPNVKEKLDQQTYKDIASLRTQPVYIEKKTGEINTPDELERTKGYIKLFKGRDNKNNVTWYAGLVETEFTGIITKPEKEDV